MNGNKSKLQSNHERRRFQRISIPLKVSYKIIGRRGMQGKAKCANISGGGIKIWIKHSLEPGDKLEVTFSIPNSIKPITAIGKVAWVGKADGQFKGGLQFIKIKFKPKFTKFICEEMINLSLQQKT